MALPNGHYRLLHLRYKELQAMGRYPNKVILPVHKNPLKHPFFLLRILNIPAAFNRPGTASATEKSGQHKNCIKTKYPFSQMLKYVII
jgi:hypothetical protein